MNFEKIKEIIKNKKVQVVSGAVAGALIIVIAGTMILHNKSITNKNVAVEKVDKKEETTKEEKEVKDKLEELKKIDTSKLSEEEKKNVESKIADIEKLISNKEYVKVKMDIESVKSDINTKIEELAKKEEKTEVASNTISSTSNTTSSNTSTSSNSESSLSSSQGTVQQESTQQVEQSSEPSYTPPVVEEPVQPSPAPTPTPQPPVETPSYPSVGEVKQRLIAYGQSLGLTYDPSITYDNADKGTGTDQMWSSERGNSADQWIVNSIKSTGCYAFNIEVIDLGNGFCSMKAYGIMNWD